jgi:hypothetical protein
MDPRFRLAREIDFAKPALHLEADHRHPQDQDAGLLESVIPADDLVTCSP